MTIQITKDYFEDVWFNPALIVVEKSNSNSVEHITVLYVFEKIKCVRSLTRTVTAEGTTYEETRHV